MQVWDLKLGLLFQIFGLRSLFSKVLCEDHRDHAVAPARARRNHV